MSKTERSVDEALRLAMALRSGLHVLKSDAQYVRKRILEMGFAIVPVEPTDVMVLASIILPNDPKEAQLREAFKLPKHKEAIDRTRASIKRAIQASQEQSE